MAHDTSDDRVSISYVIDRLDGLVSQDTAALSDISSFVEFRDELVFNLGQNVLTPTLDRLMFTGALSGLYGIA